jgi:iron complex outermembrane receptor protein
MKQNLLNAALFGAVTFMSAVYAETPTEPIELGEMVVTATRFNDVPESAAVGVTVITAEDIKKSVARTLPDLLAQYAGVQTRSNDGTSDKMVDLRGFGMSGVQNTLVLLDGLPLNDIELTSVRWSSIPLESVARIEIMKGSGAVLYGGGATGGTINILTKKAGGQTGGGVDVGAGSYQAHNAQLAMRATNAHLTIGATDTDNYRANNRNEQINLEMDVRRNVGSGDVVLKFGADSQDLRFPGVRKVDPSTGVDELASNRRGTATPLDYGTRRGAHFNVGTQQLLGWGEIAAELAYRNKDQQAYYDFNGFPSYLNTNLHVWSFTPRLKTSQHIGAYNTELVAGMDVTNWLYDSERSNTPASALTAQVRSAQQNRALYIQDTAQLNAATQLTLGARHQHVAYRVEDVLNPAAYASGQQARNIHAYDIGLRHDLGTSWSVFGRAGRSFRIATVDEVYNQFGGPSFDSSVAMLEPQTSQDREVGLDYRGDKTKLHAALYQMRLNNEIHYNALTFANMNLAPTRRYGLELEAHHTFSEVLEASAAYSYAVAKFHSGVYDGVDVSGNNMPLVPRQRLASSASYKLASRTMLSGQVNYVGQQYFDNDQANTFGKKMPAYVTLDLKLAHQAGSWQFAAVVNNAFNRKYYTYAIENPAKGNYNAYPMPERNVALDARYRF